MTAQYCGFYGDFPVGQIMVTNTLWILITGRFQI